MTKTSFIVEPDRQEIVSTHTFNAPRELVFKAFTDPKHVAAWWRPNRITNIIETWQPHKGGVWRIIQRDEKGEEFIFNGVFHEVIAPEMIVRTFEYEGAPGHVSLETITFEELNKKTKVIDQLVFQTVADRDAMFNAGMQEDSSESMQNLAKLVESK